MYILCLLTKKHDDAQKPVSILRLRKVAVPALLSGHGEHDIPACTCTPKDVCVFKLTCAHASAKEVWVPAVILHQSILRRHGQTCRRHPPESFSVVVLV